MGDSIMVKDGNFKFGMGNVAVKLYEFIEFEGTILKKCTKMEFDLCDLNDLDDQGHHPEIDWHPQEHMAKLYSNFKLKAVRHFEISCKNRI